MVESKKLISKIWRPEPDKSQRFAFCRFERNERTTLFSEVVFNDMLSGLTSYDFVAYGELEPFYEKICEWLGVERGNILLTSGSDAGIKAVFETYVNEGDEILISLPNYAMFSVYTSMFGGKEVQHFYNSDLSCDAEGFIKKINQKTKLTVISNPGHTGTVIKEDDLVAVLEKANRNKSLVLLDEAYHHFYPGTMLDYIDSFENLVITRTFSKAFGLASLRIGLLIGCKEVIDELYKVKLVHEITGVAAKIGVYMLDHFDIVNDYLNRVNAGKEILYRRLSVLDFEVLRSEANFVFFKPPGTVIPKELVKYLEDKRVLIKGPFEKHPFDSHLRITVGDEDQINYFCDIVKIFMNR